MYFTYSSSQEIERTKERLWNMMNKPEDFVRNKNQDPDPLGHCNSACWVGCDRFEKRREPDWCPLCGEIPGTEDFCCTGWCGSNKPKKKELDAILPTPSKFLSLSFHDCLK